MARKVNAVSAARKYADDDMITITENPQRTSANLQRTTLNQMAYEHSMPAPVRPSFLAHISKPIGRKKLCHDLRISKHLLDMWISGERKDPIERVRDIMQIAAECYGPDLPLDIAQELVEEFGGLVVRRRDGRK